MTARKQCLKPSCYLQGTKVDTDLTECIACGEELSKVNPLGDLFGLDAMPGFGSALFDREDQQ